MEFRYVVEGQSIVVRVERQGEGFVVRVGETSVVLTEVRLQGGVLSFTAGGRRHLAHVAVDGPHRWVALDARPYVLEVPQPGRARRGRGGGGEALEAQMPGVVRRVFVASGERVEAGQALLLLEAMKMEIRVSAPHAGVLKEILVAEGQPVERGQVLAALGEASEEP